MRYRWVNGEWRRSLVLYRPGTTCVAPPNPACDFTDGCTIQRAAFREEGNPPTDVPLTPESPPPQVSETFYDDTFLLGVRYVWRIWETISYVCYRDGQETTYTATSEFAYPGQVREVLPSDNQSVDSRYDLRYGNPTFLDFQFGSRTYRGGLFVGNAADPSRVARSYLKFWLPAPPAGSTGRHVSTLNAWFTRAHSPGTVRVEARRSVDLAWTENQVVWSTAPAFSEAATDTQTVIYDPEGGRPGQEWVRWKIHDDVEAAYGAGAPALTEVLTSADETVRGWAYFAKRQFRAGREPRLFVVFRF